MMRDDKLIELFRFYAKGEAGGRGMSSVKPVKLYAHGYYELRDYEDAHWELDKRRHVAWMAQEAIGFLEEVSTLEGDIKHGVNLTNANGLTIRSKNICSKREKAHRWLGFIQGVLWMAGCYTLDQLKEHSHKCSDDNTGEPADGATFKVKP